MVLHQTLNVVNFFKGLSENMLELFLKRKGLELDIETLKSANGQQYWEDSVDESVVWTAERLRLSPLRTA